MSRSRWVTGWLALACFLEGARQVYADQFTQAEIQQLLTQLGSNADQALRDDLANPSLLPADGRHQAFLYWEAANPGQPRGWLTVVNPPGSRVGEKLRTLRTQGVSFSDSVTVRRLLSAADSWAVRSASVSWGDAIADADFRIWDAATLQGVTTPSATFIWNALASWPELRDMFIVSELSRDFPAYSVMSDPRPGEVWCYQIVKATPVPGGFHCEGEGSGCDRKIDCPRPPPVVPPLQPGEVAVRTYN